MTSIISDLNAQMALMASKVEQHKKDDENSVSNSDDDKKKRRKKKKGKSKSPEKSPDQSPRDKDLKAEDLPTGIGGQNYDYPRRNTNEDKPLQTNPSQIVTMQTNLTEMSDSLTDIMRR